MFSVDNDPMIINNNYKQVTLTNIDFSVEDIMNIVKVLDNNKSAGPDNIHIRLIKEGISSISIALKIIFDRSIKFNEVPDDWKSSPMSARTLEPGEYAASNLSSCKAKVSGWSEGDVANLVMDVVM